MKHCSQLRLLPQIALAACVLAALPVHAQTAVSAPEGRVIVRFKTDPAKARVAAVADRARMLGLSVGLSLSGRTQVSADTQVFTARGVTSAELARRLANQPEVAAVEVDRRMSIRLTPNDPLFSTRQWYLQAAQYSAIDAQGAWDLTTGSPAIVVAVIDTGVRLDHEDLSAKLLPGYDFVSCDAPGDCTTANDGNGRDGDPSDPGDWEYPYASSWHGTRVASIIGASTNNAVGIAGISWGSRILPVRALGVGGGYLSDIAAAMRWAAGLSVPDVPANANPARVLNLSLGGNGLCGATYQQAVDEVTAAGAIVVAAVGNDTGPVEAPANCRGVLAVAGVRHTGHKAGYSSCGAQVGIAAPAGNCVNTAPGSACLYQIGAATNYGTTSPSLNGYTDSFDRPNYGTSFSAPQASGVAALMLSANANLTPAQLIARIQASAKPFPAPDPALPTCPMTGLNGSEISGQCNCTTATCGAGLLNAAGATAQAFNPAPRISVGAIAVGSPIALDGAASGAAGGSTIASWSWSVTAGPAGTTLSGSNTSAAQLTVSQAGAYTVALTVIDTLGRSATEQQTLYIGVAAPAPVSRAPADCAVNTGEVVEPPPASGSSSGGGDGGGGGGSMPLLGVLSVLVLAGAVRRRSRDR